MNTYIIYRAHYTPIDPIFWRLKFEPVREVEALTAEKALEAAKRLGFSAPVVGLLRKDVS